ncbi:MAG: Bpu10I family restriction endonuclease [Gammaproteobacteria bacterium]|nr:Bpu10I family restriction endonuclease [Gammaproteobacteria bacterium]
MEPPDKCLDAMVKALNDYKFFFDADFIFDSSNGFLYRQKGQLKIDNTIIEEFLPRLISPTVIPELQEHEFTIGPVTAYSSVSFESTIHTQPDGGGMVIKSKDQDFAITKMLYLKSSHNSDFSDSITEQTYLTYVASECKTNLDKTMFQEASATAQDLKTAVVGAKYYLIAEWPDMTPLSTATTYIDEVLILRKAKRMSSNIRANYGSYAGRVAARDDYRAFLKKHPFEKSVFQRFCYHIAALFPQTEDEVLKNGFF